MSGQPSPYSAESSAGAESSAAYWKDLAEQRGHLLHDMTDKWAERRVEFVMGKRAMGEQLFELRTRERTLTYRITELERTVMIVRSLLHAGGTMEARFAAIQGHVNHALNRSGEAPRGGYAGAQQE